MDPSIEQSLEPLLRMYKELRGDQVIVRRALLIRVMATLDGYSMQALDRLMETHGVQTEESLVNIQFKCGQCGKCLHNYVDYRHHLIWLHLPSSLLREWEQKELVNVKRTPFNKLGLGDADGMSYNEEQTFTIDFQ